jgi:hypothetical protein
VGDRQIDLAVMIEVGNTNRHRTVNRSHQDERWRSSRVAEYYRDRVSDEVRDQQVGPAIAVHIA